MKLATISENRILYTLKPFKWLTVFAAEKGISVITPLTTVASLLKIKSGSELYEFLMGDETGIDHYLSVNAIERKVHELNEMMTAPVLSFDRTGEKILKDLFVVDPELMVTPNLLEKYLTFLDARATKRQTIVLAGFDGLVFGEFKMLTVHLLQTTLGKTLHWGNLERLVMLDVRDLGEVIDKERLKAWLELKTRTVLRIEDINEYFQGGATMNSFLIERAIRQLSS